VDGGGCAFGNVAAVNVVHMGASWEVEQEVRRQLKLGRSAKGFMMYQGSLFPPDTEPAKMDMFIRAVHRVSA